MLDFDPDWWKKIFDELYLITDAGSIGNSEVTKQEVDLVEDLIKPNPRDRILDLCGGHGRHTIELAKRGYKNLVLADYSFPLLSHACNAVRSNHLFVNLCRCDARFLSIATSSFDTVILMGNSFGYFSDDRNNKRILNEIARVLKPGGKLLLDLINRDYAITQFNPESEHEAELGFEIIRKRTLGKKGITVREKVVSGADKVCRDITYFSRLFTDEEIREYLTEAGFNNINTLKGFSPHKTKADYGMLTNRLIVTAVRSSPYSSHPGA